MVSRASSFTLGLCFFLFSFFKSLLQATIIIFLFVSASPNILHSSIENLSVSFFMQIPIIEMKFFLEQLK